MQLRQLEAFVALANELHFGRTADRLGMGTATLSELIRRLERDLGAPLFTRTSRRVTLTAAGVELFGRATSILEEVESATAAVRRVAAGDSGPLHLGITPPVVPTLGPHLVRSFTDEMPDVHVNMQRMWLPTMTEALRAGDIDVAITCGLVADPPGAVSEVFCGEPLLVGLRPDHRLASKQSVSMADLGAELLGVSPTSLFPAWALAQRQALEAAGVSPPTSEINGADLTAARWSDQAELDWILLTPSLAAAHVDTVVRPLEPEQFVPFTLQWIPKRTQTTTAALFVHLALSTAPPIGWRMGPDHLAYLPPG
jgi:DNA-binding transcriptional LysR family regulator